MSYSDKIYDYKYNTDIDELSAAFMEKLCYMRLTFTESCPDIKYWPGTLLYNIPG